MKRRLNTIGFAPCVAKELEMKFITLMNVMTVQIAETRETLLKPFQTKWKGVHQITLEELCKAILGCQNADMLKDIGNFCYGIQKVFKNQTL